MGGDGVQVEKLGGIMSVPFEIQPSVQIVDGDAQRTSPFGPPLNVSVRFFNNPGCGILAGNLLAPVVGNTANFTNLVIKSGGRGFVSRFCVSPCQDNKFLEVDDALSVEFTMRQAVLEVIQHPRKAFVRQAFKIQPVVRVLNITTDRQGKYYEVTNRAFKFGITASFNQPGVELLGQRTVWPVGGIAYFTDLRLDVSGFRKRNSNFRLIFTTCPGEPDCEVVDGEIDDDVSSVVSNEFDVAHGLASALRILQEPTNSYTGEIIGSTCAQYKGPECLVSTLENPPTLQIADDDGNVVLTGNWFLCVRLVNMNSGVDDLSYMRYLRGNIQVKFTDGIAAFTDLDISYAQGNYTFIFSVFQGIAVSSTTCQGVTVFATATSKLFNIDYSYASQILPLIQPRSILGPNGYRFEIEYYDPMYPFKESILTHQPVVSFADDDSNVITLAHCESPDPMQCDINIQVAIDSVSTEDSTYPAKLYGTVAAVPKGGRAVFTDIGLLRMGTYVLTFFSGILTAKSEPFYVGSGRAVQVHDHISPRYLGPSKRIMMFVATNVIMRDFFKSDLNFFLVWNFASV